MRSLSSASFQRRRQPRDVVRLKPLLEGDDFDQHVLPGNSVRHSESGKLLRRDRDSVSQNIVGEFVHLVRLARKSR